MYSPLETIRVGTGARNVSPVSEGSTRASCSSENHESASRVSGRRCAMFASSWSGKTPPLKRPLSAGCIAGQVGARWFVEIVLQASGERIPARRFAGSPENVARLGRVDECVGIFLEEEPLLEELLRSLRDRLHEAGVALVALLERSARVAVRKPLGLGLREGNERAAEAAEVRRPEPGAHVPS